MHSPIYLYTLHLDLEELGPLLVFFDPQSNQDHTSYHESLRFLAQPVRELHDVTHSFAFSKLTILKTHLFVSFF